MILKKSSLSEKQLLFAERIGLNCQDDGLSIETKKGANLKIIVSDDKIIIEYSEICEIFRGLALLKEGYVSGTVIEQNRSFDSLAAFYDCSRNAVATPKTLKEFVMDIAALGFNQLYLYTEDTFEVPEYPYFGYLRGRYTAEEIREVDSFAKEYGIEIIPAMQTLAHLKTVFRWEIFDEINDVADILFCGEEKTYDFIEKMVASLRDMYSTDKINIGMDEAHLMGLGKYLEKHGYKSKMDIFLNHIGRVMDILRKYDFKPLMWSDMFFKIATGRCTYEELNAIKFDDEVLDLIPEEMSLIYWNYGASPEEYYDSLIKAHMAMKRKIVFAGGCQKWLGLCPNYRNSFNASRNALSSVKRNGIKDVIVTAWGDDGGDGSQYLTLPVLTLYAEKCYTDDMSDEVISRRLSTVFGYSLEEFMLLESPNRIPEDESKQILLGANSNKPILFNDPLLGLYDRHIGDGTNDYYLSLKNPLKELANKQNKISYVFETIYFLCDLLSVKSEFGKKLRAAYKDRNEIELENLLMQIPVIIEKIDELHTVLRKNWCKENKIFGFEVQDIRYGALCSRFIYTKEVLEKYLANDIEKIAELEETILYMDCRPEDSDKPLHYCCNNWRKIVTANVLVDTV